MVKTHIKQIETDLKQTFKQTSNRPLFWTIVVVYPFWEGHSRLEAESFSHLRVVRETFQVGKGRPKNR